MTARPFPAGWPLRAHFVWAATITLAVIILMSIGGA